MERILLNANAVKKNKDLKKINKISSKYYGKTEKAVIKSKLCKLVDVSDVKLVKADNYVINENCNIPITTSELIEKVQAAGLVGMSGSGFSVANKLCTFIASKAHSKTLIVNAVECEPGLVHDEWLIKNKYQEICEGINILRHCLQIPTCIIATKNGSDNGESKYTPSQKHEDMYQTNNITVQKVPAKYPMGAERVLIKQVLGVELNKNEIPAESGILVMNVQTVYQLYLACTGNTINGRYVTLANIDKGEAVVSYIEYGTDIKATLVEQFGTCGDFYAGGGLLGSHPLKDVETFTERTLTL